MSSPLPTKKRKLEENPSDNLCENKHFPKFTIKPGTRQRPLSDISNLMLWIFSETSGKMPSWIFVQVLSI